MSIELRGTVCDGQGVAKGFTALDWVRVQFRAKVGFDPYPGTLNLRTQDAAQLACIRATPGIPIMPDSAKSCPAQAWRVRVAGQVIAAWILPDVPGYPADVLELMAPVSLRQALGLKTGDSVVVEFAGANDE